MAIGMNGSSSIKHHYHDSFTTGTTKKKKKSSPSSLFASVIKNDINSKVMVICLGLIVIITILVDSYFLYTRDPSAFKTVRRQRNRILPSNILHGGTPGYAQVKDNVKTQRERKRLDNNHNNINLPKLIPKNHNFTEEGNINSNSYYDRIPILKVFEQAGIPPLNESTIATLPTWKQIVNAIGAHPVIGGLDTCDAYKQNVPAVERMLGSSGMFNTGTNLVTHLLKNNCKIPERVAHYGWNASREMHGMRWQVPWGKHSFEFYKALHSTKQAKAINKDWIMPVVTIRHPYSWMHSMCKNGYTSRWRHGRKGQNCPNLRPGGEWNEVTTKFAEGRTENSESLAHLWNDWYGYWFDADYPRLMVRLEDLVFHAKETTTTICTCVGGEIRTDRPFTYVLDSAKADSRGHDTSTGFIQAWIKYSKELPPNGGFTRSDYEAAKEALNLEYMEKFHYKHAQPDEGASR